jgi:hypothetical protein
MTTDDLVTELLLLARSTAEWDTEGSVRKEAVTIVDGWFDERFKAKLDDFMGRWLADVKTRSHPARSVGGAKP